MMLSMNHVGKVEESLDQTVIPIFRAFAGIRLGMTILFLVVNGNLQDVSVFSRIMAAVDALLLIAYLSPSPLRAQLGRYYLPIGLLWASFVPIVIQGFGLWTYFQDINTQAILDMRFLNLEAIVSETVIDWVLLATVGQMLIALMAPLVILAWRYSLRAVLFFQSQPLC
ncbi:hypothetical protein HC928_04665 [bacterium]|nr:hypothetical protein [bacterium]